MAHGKNRPNRKVDNRNQNAEKGCSRNSYVDGRGHGRDWGIEAQKKGQRRKVKMALSCTDITDMDLAIQCPEEAVETPSIEPMRFFSMDAFQRSEEYRKNVQSTTFWNEGVAA